MTLTPTIKFVLIATYVTIQVAGWIWLGSKVDLLALNFNEHLYNIGAVILGSLNTAIGGVMVYLGMRAPVLGEEVRDVERGGVE